MPLNYRLHQTVICGSIILREFQLSRSFSVVNWPQDFIPISLRVYNFFTNVYSVIGGLRSPNVLTIMMKLNVYMEEF